MTEGKLDLIKSLVVPAPVCRPTSRREPADLATMNQGYISGVDGVGTEMLSYLAEEHHHLEGRPWDFRSHADYLLSRSGLNFPGSGLRMRCGKVECISFRTLRPKLGTDHCLGLLKAFAAYEIPLHGLDRKQPVLLWAGVSRLLRPAGLHSCSRPFVSMYMARDQRRELFDNVVRLLGKEGG